MTRPESGAKPAPDVIVRNVSKSFGGTPALAEIDLEVRQGEFLTLLGPSGCGKSTLLRMIAGLENPDRGTIHLAGRDMRRVPPHRRPVSMVFQNLALFPHMSVFDNIGYALKVAGQRKTEIRPQVEEYLELVQMGEFASRRVADLSGGQRQRVALARSLAHKPTVLLLDEPLSALDKKLRSQMQVELKQFQRRMGTTFIFVTHDQEEALVMSDRIAVFSKGRLDQIGGPLEIYQRPSTPFVATFIGDTNMISGTCHRHGDRSTVTLNSVSFDVAEEQGRPDEGCVWVSIRPEHVHVARRPDELPGEARVGPISGRVTDVLFYGPSVHVTIATSDEQIMTSRMDVGALGKKLRVGEHVVLSWAAEATYVIARSDARDQLEGKSRIGDSQ